MIIQSIKTEKLTEQGDILAFIDRYIPRVAEQSIVVITSKVVSILEGNVIPTADVDKKALIKRQADLYLQSATASKYNVEITIKNNIMIGSSGIDESNANDHYILWPRSADETAKTVWNHLRKRDKISHCGVIITDSRIVPLRWGTLGLGLAWCGFLPLKRYIGTPDIFGRNLKMTNGSILDGLAASAVLLMGEGDEQTPLAYITDVPFVTFTDAPPTPEEIAALRIAPEDDLRSPRSDDSRPLSPKRVSSKAPERSRVRNIPGLDAMNP
jgi:putative folate metabolism gamma-glutamate ligase